MTTPTIPELLTTIMERRNLTQTELAALLGTSQEQISRWRHGRRPRPHHVAAIRALAASSDDLDTLAAATRATWSAEGKARAHARLVAAERAGLRPYELYLLGDAVWRHAEGVSQAAYLLERIELTADRAALEAAIARLQAGGWWPWDAAER